MIGNSISFFNSSYYPDSAIGHRVSGQWKFERVEGNIFGTKGEPSLADIEQTTIGDCYFLAGLKTIVRRNPDLIRDMIRDLGNGKVIVRFYLQIDDQIQPIWYQIDKSIIKTKSSKDGHKAPWVFLLEKAYAIHRLHDKDFISERKLHMLEKKVGEEELKKKTSDERVKMSVSSGLNPQAQSYDDLLSGGGAKYALHALLGCEAIQKPLDLNQDEALIKLLLFTGGEITKSMEGVFSDGEILKLFIKEVFKNATNPDFIRDQKVLEAALKNNVATKSDAWQYLGKYFSSAITHKLFIAIDHSIYLVKIGDKNYSPVALKFYTFIKNLLKLGELVCFNTKEHLSKDTKGLVKNHSYEVINCYQREDHLFIVISNPWQQKSRGYRISKTDPNILEPLEQHMEQRSGLFQKTVGQRSPEDIDRTTRHQDIQGIAVSSESYLPDVILNESGTFEIELNDLLKHFCLVEYTDIIQTKHDLQLKQKEMDDALQRMYAKKEEKSEGKAESMLQSNNLLNQRNNVVQQLRNLESIISTPPSQPTNDLKSDNTP